MTPRKRRRLYFAAAILVAAGGCTWLFTWALGDNKEFFYSPADLAQMHVSPGTAFRIGGLVVQHSIGYGAGAQVRFAVTDGKDTVPVTFNGVLPALFREGQGVVATGALDAGGTFEATEVLAKHDEKYMPPEVVDALKRSGHWKGGGT